MRGRDLIASTATPATIEERDGAELLERITTARPALVAAAATLTAAFDLLQSIVTAVSSGTSATDVGVDLSARRPGPGAGRAGASSCSCPRIPNPLSRCRLRLGGGGAAARLAVATPSAGASVEDLVAALEGGAGRAPTGDPPRAARRRPRRRGRTGLAAGDGVPGRSIPSWRPTGSATSVAVRAGAGRLAAAVQGCDALGADAGVPDRWRIVDPKGPGWAWVGGDLGAADLAAMAPAVTVVLQAGAGVDFSSGETVSGLLVDEWVEVVPQAVAATSVAYQAEAPAARAPAGHPARAGAGYHGRLGAWRPSWTSSSRRCPWPACAPSTPRRAPGSAECCPPCCCPTVMPPT